MKKKNIIIKPSKVKNIKDIVDLIAEVSLNASVIKRSYNQIFKKYKNYLVALDGEKVVGTIGFKIWPNSHIEIISLVVDKHYRGKRIGTRLIEEIIKIIKDRKSVV